MKLTPIMQTSPGVTIPKITREPLGTEGELTPGPDDINPYNSIEEKEAVKEIKRRREIDLDTGKDFGFDMINPLRGGDPYAFDDISKSGFDLPWMD